MVDITKDNLEKALNSQEKNSDLEDSQKKAQISKELEIGFRQGALTTLLNERNELVRIIKQVDMLLQIHIKRLEELGVKIQINSVKTDKEEKK